MNIAPRDLDIMDARVGVFNPRNLRHADWVVPAITLTLAVIGFFVLFSASRTGETPYYLKQAVFFLMGIAVACVIICFDYRFLVSIAPALYTVAVALLGAVFFLGVSAKGGQRWLAAGPFRIQPSEIMKLVVVLGLAWYLTKIGGRIRNLFFFLLAFAIAAAPALLILLQPNLGTALSLVPLTVVMVYVAGCRRWHLALIVILGVAAAPLAWSQMKDYQQERVLTFLNPDADPQGKGWQTVQSKITVGSGQLAGKGWRQGTQTFLRYLPEHHTDFIFSLLAEEHGFIGAVFVLALFAALLLRGLRFARDCPDVSGALIAVGAVTVLGFHVFVNVAITIGLLPVTGIPLPFLSYGGSFYLTTMMCIGLLLNVRVRRGFFDR